MRRAVVAALLALAVEPASAAAAPPIITPSVTGAKGDDNWYVTNVIVNWTITPPGYTVDAGCAPSTVLSADTTGTRVICAASNADGSSSSSVTIRLDKTPPAVTAKADRVPDGGGFYNRPFTAMWIGSDATSGVAACTSTPYAGPDGQGIALTGTCRDRAGNVSAAVPFVFNYDATPPTIGNLRARVTAKTATLAWDASGATAVTLIRASAHAPTRQRVVYQGTGAAFTDKGLTTRRDYRYILRATDQAANVATASVDVTPRSTTSSNRLLAPRPNATVHRPPLLRWRKVRKASYYNVQLFRAGHKILSAWPSKPRYRLKRSWRYNGRRQRLVDGTYDWYLWAGYGKRSAQRYGRLLGKGTFTVR